jgi:predicted transporter
MVAGGIDEEAKGCKCGKSSQCLKNDHPLPEAVFINYINSLIGMMMSLLLALAGMHVELAWQFGKSKITIDQSPE